MDRSNSAGTGNRPEFQNTFINALFLYDDKMVLTLNDKEGAKPSRLYKYGKVRERLSGRRKMAYVRQGLCLSRTSRRKLQDRKKVRIRPMANRCRG